MKVRQLLAGFQNTEGERSASCLAGEVVTGGGFNTGVDAVVTESAPVFKNGVWTWTVRGFSKSTSTVFVIVYAICAPGL